MFNTRYKSHHDVKDFISKKIGRKIQTPFSYWKKINSSPINTEDGGIYIHTPFCDKICSFCNMNRKQLDNDLNDYTQYLIKEIIKYKNKKYTNEKKISVIFFGGGTPTIFKPHQLEIILKTLTDTFNITDNCEFTFETTLHNLTDEKLEIMQKYGVNRLSVGIQTFSNRGRKLLNRTYSQEQVIEKLKTLKNKFKGLICIDIIYNYLDQSIEEILEDARISKEISPDSISFYSLMIHEGSKISKDLLSGEKSFDYQLIQDKKIHDIFLETLMEDGYFLLEHTKLTKGTDTYRYIKNTHLLKDLIPIGIGAGGRVDNIELYHLNKFITFYSKDSEMAVKMKKLSGITQERYVSFNDIKTIVGTSFDKLYETLKVLEKEDYIKLEDNGYFYTNKGVFFGNNISAKLVDCLYENK